MVAANPVVKALPVQRNDVRPRSGTSVCLTLLLAVTSGWAQSACTLGSDEPPGCRADHPEDCGTGWTCRAGVCFRTTTPLSPPAEAGDVGDGRPSDSGPEEVE